MSETILEEKSSSIITESAGESPPDPMSYKFAEEYTISARIVLNDSLAAEKLKKKLLI